GRRGRGGRRGASGGERAGARGGQWPRSAAVVESVWKSALKLMTCSAASAVEGGAGVSGVVMENSWCDEVGGGMWAAGADDDESAGCGSAGDGSADDGRTGHERRAVTNTVRGLPRRM